MQYIETKYYDSIKFPQVCSKESIWQEISIGSGNVLTPKGTVRSSERALNAYQNHDRILHSYVTLEKVRKPQINQNLKTIKHHETFMSVLNVCGCSMTLTLRGRGIKLEFFCNGRFIWSLQWRHNGNDIASQIPRLTIVYSAVYSDADRRKHQSSASLAFVRGIHRGPVNSPHKWPVTRKICPFDDVIKESVVSI